MSRASKLIVATALLAVSLPIACKSKTAGTPKTAVRQAVPLESSVLAGRYAIAGRTVTDHCDDSLVLAAKEITVDLEASEMRADAVSRSYQLDVRGDELVATGRFDILPGCGTHQYVEVWRLRPQGPDSLQGQLTTYYRDSAAADCLKACKFVTAIEAVKIQSDAPAGSPDPAGANAPAPNR